MYHATALEPRRENSGLSVDEWDRLPWLPDVPRPARRRRHAGLLLGLVGLAAADAGASYSLGKESVREGWILPIAASASRKGDACSAAIPDGQDAQILAARISKAERVGWQLRRPNAPY